MTDVIILSPNAGPPGPRGDLTPEAEQLAEEIRQKAAEAEASATKAMDASQIAGEQADLAEESAQAADADRIAANTSAQQADSAREAAEQSATDSANSAVSAGTSATSAQQSATSAQQSANSAQQSAARATTSATSAEESATAAGLSEDSASLSAADAEASAISAGSSVSLAAAVTNPFPTVEEGIANTAGTGSINRFFSVPGAEGELSILYRNDDGVPTLIGRAPSLEVLSRLEELIAEYAGGDLEAVVFTDEHKFLLLRLLVNGTLDMNKAQLINTESGDLTFGGVDGFNTVRLGVTESMINGLYLSVTHTPGIVFTDDFGFVVGKITNDGVFFGTQKVTPENIGTTYAALNRQQRTQLIHIIGYGQSLSRGAYSKPVLSVTQPYSNLMIASGTKVRANEAGYNPTSFVPLVEAELGNDGESPVTALCNGLSRRLIEGGELQDDWTFVGSSPGQGGQSVEALGPGGLGYYEKMVKLIEDHAALAKSVGKTYSVWAYTWDQGEGNYSKTGSGATATKSAYQYAQLYLELFDKLTEEVVRITGQKNRPYLFTYQVGAHRKYATDTMQIALSQWRTSRQREDVVMFAPVYIFSTDNTNGDNLHLSNEGSWLMGEYRSRAMYETMMVRNGKWKPLEPKSVEWNDSHIDVHFHVPSGHLEFDNTQVAQAVNNGFDIRENDVVVTNRITDVSVVGSGTVRLTLNQPTAVNSVLTYARGRIGDPSASGPVLGPRGNLRDTHGLYDKVVSPLGNSFDLHNWCVMFEYNRKTGF